MTHEQCLKKVCAVCTNLQGKKANRSVSDIDAGRIKSLIFPAYVKGSLHFPQGLCTTCYNQLVRLDKVSEQSIEYGDDGTSETNAASNLLLPNDYICDLPYETRSWKSSGGICTCRWCNLARLNGQDFRKWHSEMKILRDNKPQVTRICMHCGKGVSVKQKSHICNTSDVETVRNIIESIPTSLKSKLAAGLIKEIQQTKVDVCI